MSVVKKAIGDFPFNGRNFIVSCSGGIDSMVLLHILYTQGYKPKVLHVNYHLRSVDSDKDQQLVEDTAKEYGFECLVNHCPKELTKGEGINLQAAARNFRRALYKEWIDESPENCVVLGHHANDQVETFFLQYFRGSGSLGLGGMYADKNGILRPLLSITRKEIHDYALTENVLWREDKSNQTTAYVRNLFRNKLLPALSEDIPELSESVLTLMKAFREQRILNDEQLEPMISQWNSKSFLLISEWSNLHDDQKLTFLQAVELPFWVKDRLSQLINGNGAQKLETNKGILVKDVYAIRLLGNKLKSGWDFKMEEIEILPETFSKGEIYLDKALFELEDIVFRNPKAGDRIKSLGMNGSQLVSDILKESRIPEWARKEIMIAVIKGEIVWIPGCKISRMFLASEKSTEILRITC